jgi:acyl transferase domain-containing protein
LSYSSSGKDVFEHYGGKKAMTQEAADAHNMDGIAIIGLAGRFPGARNAQEFWQNLCHGVESISAFSHEALLAAGVSKENLQDSHYVRSRGILEDVELFDARFFDYTPREAELMDPQQRMFLECAWEALELAGYISNTIYRVGVFAGGTISSYLLNIYSDSTLRASIDDFQAMLGNDKDHLALRVAYKLGLKGPSVSIGTTCSTALVAVHLACQSLLYEECDVALAGGVSIELPQISGYLYQSGGITSPDGHCRAFDAKSQGTVFGNGLGVVVLKRLQEAIADGDTIYAVIKGSAINNDGSLKVGYTAPSIDGQTEVITEALGLASIDPATVTYIEAHGTGTQLGDPVEIAALTRVFRSSTDKCGYCAIGSVKTNIGHLDAAAGIAGLIKVILALKNKLIPPSLHFEEPNPDIDFAQTPFYVNTKLMEWNTTGFPRRAGVSSFGVGGTNAHVVLEEAPIVQEDVVNDKVMPPNVSTQLVLISTKTPSALESLTERVKWFLVEHPDLNIADVAYTTQQGRRHFANRRIILGSRQSDIIKTLTERDTDHLFTGYTETSNHPVVFMFPGQGSQFVNMAFELYCTEDYFRDQVDYCMQILARHLKTDILSLLYPFLTDKNKSESQLNETWLTQPVLFVIEYALAKLWMKWGVMPSALIGHSIGEYVAACIAGVFSLEDALSIVAARGRLMQQQPSGSMLIVPLSEQKLRGFLNERISIAAVNAPNFCVVSGSIEAIGPLNEKLSANGLICRAIDTSHAFHSTMMAPVLQPFTQIVSSFKLMPPSIPIISNVTGTWMTAEQATDPSYWAQHIQSTVRFSAGMMTLLHQPDYVFLETGPGQSLATLARQQTNWTKDRVALTSISSASKALSDRDCLMTAVGKLWLIGLDIAWDAAYSNARHHRIALPTYPFERQRYWLESKPHVYNYPERSSPSEKRRNIPEWFYFPSWQRSISPINTSQMAFYSAFHCLIFIEGDELGKQLVCVLKKKEVPAIVVVKGERFACVDAESYAINPNRRVDYDSLLDNLNQEGINIRDIIYAWSTPESCDMKSLTAKSREICVNIFNHMLLLIQAVTHQNTTNLKGVHIVTTNMQLVSGREVLHPEKAVLLGLLKVAPQEYPNLVCRSIDVDISSENQVDVSCIANCIVDEVFSDTQDIVVAYRGGYRWVQDFQPMPLLSSSIVSKRLRKHGVYLITGGLGAVGLILAEYLAAEFQAKLILVGRSAFPKKEHWPHWLATQPDSDQTSQKICKLQELEELGAQVSVIQADVSNMSQMEDLLGFIYEQFGCLNGVIHAAGATKELAFQSIQETSLEEIDIHFFPKVYGSFVLGKVLQHKNLDFCILFSSLSSILGGLEFAAYAGANAFIDAFVYEMNRNSIFPWISVNWDAWQSPSEKQSTSTMGGKLQETAMSPLEGIEAFRCILNTKGVSQIVVSTTDLSTRINQWVTLESVRANKQEDIDRNAVLHPRPSLREDYVCPRNKLEQSIAALWQDILRLEPIGINDNFFELGGHSLLGVQLMSQLRTSMQVDMPLKVLFEGPTVAKMADLVLQREVQQTDESILAQILEDLEDNS